MNEEEGDVWDEDSAYIEVLAKEGQRLHLGAERKEHDFDGTSDKEDKEEIEEELGFISPLDTVNPYVMFKQVLTGLKVKDRVMYQAATSLNVKLQTVLMEIMVIAEEAAGAAGTSAP